MNISYTLAHRHRARLAVETLEDRTTPTFLTSNLSGPLIPPTGLGQGIFNNVIQNFGGLSIANGDLYPDLALNLQRLPLSLPQVENEFVTGFGPGPESQVLIFGRTGNLRGGFTPFPGFRGGVNVAVGDVLGDSRAEIIVTPATNALPVVAVFTPQGRLLSIFLAFTPFYTGGLNVAVGNVADGIGAGGFNGGFTREYADAMNDQFGINVANRFKQEIIVGTATSSSRILVTDGFGAVKRDFFAFDPLYPGGVTLAVGSVDKRRDDNYVLGSRLPDTTSYDEIIVGAASLAPLIRVYSVWEGGVNLEQNFFAFLPTIGQGVTVAAGPTDGLRGTEIYASLIGTSVVRTFDGETQENLGEVMTVPPQFSRVINMTTGWFSNFGLLGPGPVPPRAAYSPIDDDTYFSIPTPPFPPHADNPDFITQDLAVVAGDGPFFQQPRLFVGALLTPAPFNGP